MPADNDVRVLGRVEYIEPNNLFVNSTGNKVQNGIPQPYEDYSFSVNLRVINGDRYACGMTGEGGDLANDFIEFSSDNGTLSFMDGTSPDGGQGYLTTNFTDISMNDPSTNTKECLGIESISVKYDSWYYPTVDIKFIDVRGASLMQPAEYEYYNNGNPNPNQGKNRARSNSDFFKAFFSFPYPLFKLSIKGFYGKEVTYDLSVLNCNIEFNSSTGNFEVSTSFIGYMYGLYGDLPFPFVYLAPYIDLYGKNTWDEKRKTMDFCYLTTDKDNPVGSPMYTFPELRMAVENAGKEADAQLEITPDGERRIELKKLIDQLDQKVLFYYPMASRKFTWWSWSKTNTEENRKGYFYISLDNSKENRRKVFEDFLTFSENLHEYNVMVAGTKHYQDRQIAPKDIFNDFYTDATEIRKKKPTQAQGASAATVSVDFTDDDIEKILGKHILSLAFHKDETNKDNPVLIFDSTKSSSGTGNCTQADFNDLIEELKTRFTNDEVTSPMQKGMAKKEWNIMAFTFDNLNYKGSIISTDNNLKTELDDVTVALDNERDLRIEKAIGFKPTIQNMFNMVFAHIDTFMSCYYNTLDNIRKKIQSDDKTRDYKTLCGNNIQVDVNENTLASESSNGGKLPPFTMFYKEETVKDSEDKKIVMVWPGSIEGGDKLDEVQLVNAIVNATSLNKKSFETVTPKNNIITREGDLVPINYYDIIHSNGNPYLDVLNDKSLSDEKSAKQVADVFIFRCFYSLLSGSYVSPGQDQTNDGLSSSVANFTRKAKLVAELEVGNVVRAFKMLKMNPTEAFLRGLNKITNNSVWIDNPHFVVKGNMSLYNWIIKKTESNEELYKCLPVGQFNPIALDKYAGGAFLKEDGDKFLKINQEGTTVNGDYACYLYSGGKKLESVLTKYTSGDFVNATKLFPNYGTVPKSVSGVSFNMNQKADVTIDGMYKSYDGLSITSPSYRKTNAGDTNIFMDPFFYAQKSREARAYLFLMGVPFGKDKKFFLPEKAENGDMPTLLLLREGACYWRNQGITVMTDTNGPIPVFANDPITYEYTINGTVVNILDDIEKNDPCFGRRYALEFYNELPKNASKGRKRALMDYFLKWADGIDPIDNPDVVIPSVSASSYYTQVEIPAPSLSFQKIEENLALWEMNGTVKQLLTPETCISSVTAEFVSSFANVVTLKTFYNVGTDGRLGTIIGNKIRTNVFMREKITDGAKIPTDFLDFYRNFRKFYLGFDTIIDFSCLDKPNISFGVPKTAMSDAVTAFIVGLKDEYKISIEKIKAGNSVDTSGIPEDKEKEHEYFRSDDLKLACYIALKSMYDRWLCSRRRESWQFSCIKERMSKRPVMSDFLRFYYIDEFYHNSGMKVSPNLTNTIETICKLGGFTDKSLEENMASTSIIKILSTIAQNARCSLLTLPTTLGLADTYTSENNSIADVFKAFPYNSAVRSNSIETSFVILSTSQKSAVLNIPDDKGKMGYKSDGFDIANTWGEIVEQPMFSDSSGDGYVVPSFGVTFAKQNQSYFKDIRLSMQDHQVTDFSIRNEVMISYQSNRGPRQTAILGQDLYSVYSNYSYSCTVTMMGDAQITPLMYFQLNNIPMWKGAYLITNVHHEITPQGMETVFTGVRQARPATPYKTDDMVMPADDAAKQTPQSQEKTQAPPEKEEDLNVSQRPLDTIDVEKVNKIVVVLDRTSFRTSKKWVNGFLTVRVYYNDGKEEIFNNVAQTIQATYGLTDKIGTPDNKIENFTLPEDTSVVFCIPAGPYSSVLVENPFTGEEYRDTNDSFYKFTDGKHITVSDTRLGFKRCEIITGETNYDKFESGGFEEISLGGTTPIMIYPPKDPDMNKQLDRDEIRATYREIFDLVKRMCAAKNPMSFLINEGTKIQEKIS